MARMIDADALKEWFPDNGEGSWTYNVTVKACIDAQPTIEAVPVIRCNNCIYYDGHYCHNKWWGDGYGNYTSPIKSKDGFCDWAERRGEE